MTERCHCRPGRAVAIFSLLLALGLGACGGGGGGPAPEPAFAVSATTPTDDEFGVPIEVIVLVTFSTPLDPDSVKSSSVRVGEIGGAGEVKGTATLLPGSDDRTLRWMGNVLLDPYQMHECQVAADVKSLGGDPLGALYRFDFRTGPGDSGPDLPQKTDLRATQERLAVGRRLHTATLLQGGTVLIAGGFTQGFAVTDIAESYAVERFRTLANRMALERAGHTATRLLDGKVLLCGGWYETSPQQLATTATAEIYDPSTESFRQVGAMHEERVDHAALRLPDGRVLVTGGSYSAGGGLWDLDNAEIYDPATETFALVDDLMVHTRATHAMVDTGQGKFVLVGGFDSDIRPEYFDPATGLFEPLEQPVGEKGRQGPAGASFGDGVAVFAGGDTLGSVLTVDPATDEVQRSGSPLSVQRRYATATRIAHDQVFVAGGLDFTYDVTHQSTDLIVQGGLSGSRTWATEVVFPTAMVFHTATRLQNGTVLFCGGLAESPGAPDLDGAYLFTP